MPPNKRLRTSTPDSIEWQPEKEPIRCPLKEIVNQRPALQIHPGDIVAAPGGQAANMQRGLQRLNAMAGRGRNLALQGADPALVQILQMMQNRDANRDNSQKQFLQDKIKRKQKAIGPSFLSILTIKINKVPSHGK